MFKQYDDSAKAKMIRVAADEKDKRGASKKGVEELKSDVEAMVDGETTPAKMYNGPKMETNAQEKTNLMSDNPIASRASGGSWLSKHIHRM